MKKTLLVTALFASFTVSAGQLVIENGNGKVALSTNDNNALTINGTQLAQVKHVYDDNNVLVGTLQNISTELNFVDERSTAVYYMAQRNSNSRRFVKNSLDGSIEPISTIDLLMTINVPHEGVNYTVNVDAFNRIPSSAMVYLDQDCKQAAYVVASSIPSSILFKNTIVTDDRTGKAFVFDTSVSFDNARNKTLYVPIGDQEMPLGINAVHLPPLGASNCVPLNQNEIDRLKPIPVKPLPEGIVDYFDTEDCPEGEAISEWGTFVLSGVSDPLHIQ